MWPLTLLLIAQVVGCFVADGIVTYDATLPAEFTNEFKSLEDPNNTWKSILRSAMFRTLVKYTGFSPSLDVKMEADTLLWEKLNGAKYTRKVPKPDEDNETLKTGVLIDLSRENGHLEFRQVDKSLYTLEPKDHRLLALWRMRLLQPNHYLIQIKVPEDPPIEHFYEYTQAGGLKETSLKNVDYSRSKQNKNGTWKVRQRKAYAPQSDVHTNVNTYPKRPDHYVIRNHQFNGNRYKSPQQTYRNGKAPRTYLYKPTTQYYTVVGIQTPPPVQKYPTWNDYYQPNYPTNQVKDYTEFKQDKEYDGFLPSLGPVNKSPAYHVTSNEAVPMQTYPTTSNDAVHVQTYQSSTNEGVPMQTYPGASNDAVPVQTYQSSTNEAAPVTTYYGTPTKTMPVQAYSQSTTYFPAYTADPSPPTQSPYPMTYFKPSTQFIQYSEVDPFYSTQNDSYSTYGVINTAAAGLSLLGQYPLYYNSLPTAAISVQIPPVEAGKSLYDLAINTLRNDSFPEKQEYTENVAQPTATSFTVNYSPETESFSRNEYTTESSQLTTIEVLKPTITEISQTKTRVKNSLRTPSRASNSGGENYEYAPLYVQWGEKIKPSDKIKTTTPKIRTTERSTTPKVRTTERSTTPKVRTTERLTTPKTNPPTTEKLLEKKNSKNDTVIDSKPTEKKNISETIIKTKNVTIPQKPSERLQEIQKRRLLLKKQQDPKQEEAMTERKEPKINETMETVSNETFSSSENTTNFVINNIEKKSPEEIVRDYTTMGLRNSTSVENSENLRNVNAKNNAKEAQNKENDNQNEGSEPVSVVVNRISQSFSYKTSEGESKNLRQLVEKT